MHSCWALNAYFSYFCNAPETKLVKSITYLNKLITAIVLCCFANLFQLSSLQSQCPTDWDAYYSPGSVTETCADSDLLLCFSGSDLPCDANLDWYYTVEGATDPVAEGVLFATEVLPKECVTFEWTFDAAGAAGTTTNSFYATANPPFKIGIETSFATGISPNIAYCTGDYPGDNLLVSDNWQAANLGEAVAITQDHFELCIEITDECDLEVTGLAFQIGGSSTGATNMAIFAEGALIEPDYEIENFETCYDVSYSMSEIALAGTDFCFSMYGWGGQTDLGTMRMDDMVVEAQTMCEDSDGPFCTNFSFQPVCGDDFVFWAVIDELDTCLINYAVTNEITINCIPEASMATTDYTFCQFETEANATVNVSNGNTTGFSVIYNDGTDQYTANGVAPTMELPINTNATGMFTYQLEAVFDEPNVANCGNQTINETFTVNILPGPNAGIPVTETVDQGTVFTLYPPTVVTAGGTFTWYYDAALTMPVVDEDLATPETQVTMNATTTFYFTYDSPTNICFDTGEWIIMVDMTTCVVTAEDVSPIMPNTICLNDQILFSGGGIVWPDAPDYYYLVLNLPGGDFISYVGPQALFNGLVAGNFEVYGLAVDEVALTAAGFNIVTYSSWIDLENDLINGGFCYDLSTNGQSFTVSNESNPELVFDPALNLLAPIEICSDQTSIDLNEWLEPGSSPAVWSVVNLVPVMLTGSTLSWSENQDYNVILNATASNGCGNDSQDINLNIVASPDLSNIKNDTICEGSLSPDILIGLTVGADPTWIYEWYTTETSNTPVVTLGNLPTLDLPNFSLAFGLPTTTTSYWLEATNGDCSVRTEVIVTVDIAGCTDPTACNFDPAAECDDGSCVFDPPASTEIDYHECDDGSGMAVFNLNDPDSLAIIVGGDPDQYIIEWYTTGFVEITDQADAYLSGNQTVLIVYYPDLTCTSETVSIDLIVDPLGCTDPTACNYDASINCEDGSCMMAPTCNADPCLGDVEIIDPTDACTCIVDEIQVLGCTDNTACNFEPLANCNDAAACVYETACDADPCTNGGTTIWDAATCSCIVDLATVLGCTDPTACNFDPTANCNDAASCIFETACDNNFCTNGGTTIWDAASCACVVDIATVLGCLDPTACNFDNTANCDDGSCQAAPTCNTDPCLGDIEMIDPADACSCIFIESQVIGCDDPAACNYDIAANCNNSLCVYEAPCDMDICTNGGTFIWDDVSCSCQLDEVTILGCTDVNACNFNPLANCDNASCTATGCSPGCTDPCAPNYDPAADEDDGSCDPYDTTCNADCTLGDVTEWSAGTCSCILLTPSIQGCTDMTACNYDPLANCGNGSCLPVPTCNTDPCAGDVQMIDPVDACLCITIEVQENGCTDPTACNYNPAANCDDGSCVFEIVCNANPCLEGGVNTWNDVTCSCEIFEPTVGGCTDPTACNYNPAANCDDGSCTAPPCGNGGCLDPCSANYDPAADFDDGTCDPYNTTCDTDICSNGGTYVWDVIACDCLLDEATVSGCTNPVACNYNPAANCDDANCDLGNQTCPDPCNAITGCMDAAACNFDPAANCDDGSCDLGDQACPDPCNVIYGCLDPAACNFDNTANCDDGSCLNPPCGTGGCLDPCSANYNPAADFDDGTCDPYDDTCDTDICSNGGIFIWDETACACILDVATVLGCMDATACNFDPAANCDDGSCDLGDQACPDPCNVIYGCLDPTACNFDNTANCDDGSCLNPPCGDGGCTDPCAPNFDIDADFDDGSCLTYSTDCDNDPCTNAGITQWDSISCDCVLIEATVEGCTDMAALNFDPAANCNDNSCMYDTPCMFVLDASTDPIGTVCPESLPLNLNNFVTGDLGGMWLADGNPITAGLLPPTSTGSIELTYIVAPTPAQAPCIADSTIQTINIPIVPDAGNNNNGSVCANVLDGDTEIDLDGLLSVDPLNGTWIIVSPGAPTPNADNLVFGGASPVGSIFEYGFVVSEDSACDGDTAIFQIAVLDCALNCTAINANTEASAEVCQEAGATVDLDDYILGDIGGTWSFNAVDLLSSDYPLDMVGDVNLVYTVDPPATDPAGCMPVTSTFNLSIFDVPNLPVGLADSVCVDQSGTFDLNTITALEAWFFDEALTSQITGVNLMAPAGSVVYGTVQNGSCNSDYHTLTVLSIPIDYNFESTTVCAFNGISDLSVYEDQVWFEDEFLMNQISEADLEVGPGVYYAAATNGICFSGGIQFTVLDEITIIGGTVQCDGVGAYSASITINGGVGPYTLSGTASDNSGVIAASPGEPVVINLDDDASVYELIIDDQNGNCSDTISFTIPDCSCPITVTEAVLLETEYCIGDEMIINPLDFNGVIDGPVVDYEVVYVLADFVSGEIFQDNASGNLPLLDITNLPLTADDYCVHAIGYYIPDGLNLIGANVNTLTNNAGTTIADGACISVSPCAEINIADNPAAPNIDPSGCVDASGDFDLGTIAGVDAWFIEVGVDLVEIDVLLVSSGTYFAANEVGNCISDPVEFTVSNGPEIEVLNTSSCDINTGLFTAQISISNPVGEIYNLTGGAVVGGNPMVFDDGMTVDFILDPFASMYNLNFTPTLGLGCPASFEINVPDCNCSESAVLNLPSPICNGNDSIDLSLYETANTAMGSWSVTLVPIGATMPVEISNGFLFHNGADPGIYELTYTVDVPNVPECATSTQMITVIQGPNSGFSNQASILRCSEDPDLIVCADFLSGADLGGIWSEDGANTSLPGSFDAVAGVFDPFGQADGEYIFLYTIPATADCPASTSQISVIIESNANVDLFETTTICNNSFGSFELNFDNQISSGPTTGTWTDLNGSNAVLISTFPTVYDFTNVAAGSYLFQYNLVGNPLCPVQLDSIEVVVEDCEGCLQPALPITLVDSIASCNPSENDISFEFNMLPIELGVNWYDQNNQLISNDETFTPNETGLYFAEVFWLDNDTCVSTDLAEFEMIGTADFTVNIIGDSSIYEGESSQLNVIIDPAGSYSYIWDMSSDGLNNYNISDPLASPDFTTTYGLTVEDEIGCANDTTFTIEVELGPMLAIPNAFSPNNDGANDVFRPMHRDINAFHFIVFNRFGQVLFETNDPNDGWDGYFNQEPQEMGVYVYMLEYNFNADPEMKKKGGDFTLVR